MKLIDDAYKRELDEGEVVDTEKEIQEELAQMTFRQRLEHFWEYEKWKVIIPIAAILVINSLVQTYLSETQELTLYVAMINAKMESIVDVTFDDEYMEEFEIDNDEYPFKVEVGLLHPEVMDEMAARDEIVVATMQKYQGLLISGKNDVTISNEWSVKEYAKSDVYVNLEELLPEELFHQLQDKLFYFENMQGEQIPIGINVEEIDKISQFYEKTPILVVSEKSERKQEAVAFIKWLIETDK